MACGGGFGASQRNPAESVTRSLVTRRSQAILDWAECESERAKEIGGKFTICSAPGSGTELELSIPGSVAYATSSRTPHSRLTGRLFQGSTAQMS